MPVKVFLRPYRGEPIQREFKVKIPAGLAKGDHRILLSDADTVNRMQNMAGFDEPLHGPAGDGFAAQSGAHATTSCTFRWCNRAPRPITTTRRMPSLPSSVLNVMQAGRASNRSLVTSPETASEQMSLPFDYVVTGSYSLRIHVK